MALALRFVDGFVDDARAYALNAALADSAAGRVFAGDNSNCSLVVDEFVAK
jgi:hypothetical protein